MFETDYHHGADGATRLVCQGKDRVALLYASQLNTLRQNLYSKIRLARKTESHDFNTAGFQRSWCYAAWASFKIEVSVTVPQHVPSRRLTYLVR